MIKVSAIVLAAGRSSRMGDQNKLLMQWKSATVIAEVLRQLSASLINERIVVVNDLTFEGVHHIPSIKVVKNPNYLNGMTSSIQAGVAQAKNENSGYMICLADQPLIHSDTYNDLIIAFQLAHAENRRSIVVPTFNGKRGNPVIFSSHFRDEILNHKEPEGCRDIVFENEKHITTFPCTTTSIIEDIDTPEDYISIKRKSLGSE